MESQPFYHLRPNKHIDRSLFIQTLTGLNRIYPLEKYVYTGFGSYLFDDFILMHNTLNISKMISLEKDFDSFKRAQFNKPYYCIDILNIDSTEYLASLELDDTSNNIFWLDYVAPSELGAQLSDYATLLKLLNPNDIVRITLNANPSSLGAKSSSPDKIQEDRLKILRERVQSQYLPTDIQANDITTNNYPLLLLKILRRISRQTLTDEPPYNSNFMFPLFSTVYSDSRQQMVTFTGIVLDTHEQEAKITSALSNYPHNKYSWETPCRIAIPPLSANEINAINKLLPNNNIRQQLLDNYSFIFQKDQEAIDSYISYYKYYPNFHLVNF